MRSNPVSRPEGKQARLADKESEGLCRPTDKAAFLSVLKCPKLGYITINANNILPRENIP